MSLEHFDPSFDAYEELVEVIKFCKAADVFIETFNKNQTHMIENINHQRSRIDHLERSLTSIEEILYIQKEQISSIHRVLKNDSTPNR
jgi:hypothetical protein|tara:strand:+ start:4230 stop:4493 length:264 start_codon:yes stop_codon:yes gene_type:complete